MMRRIALTLAIVLMACGARPAAAERLVVWYSHQRVAIASNFIGEELVLFGTLRPDLDTASLRPSYDLVVTVTGPRNPMRTRRKQRVLGIWVNVDFARIRSRAVVSCHPEQPPGRRNRPAECLRRMQIGLADCLLPQRIGPDIADTVQDDPFRLAFVRLRFSRVCPAKSRTR